MGWARSFVCLLAVLLSQALHAQNTTSVAAPDNAFNFESDSLLLHDSLFTDSVPNRYGQRKTFSLLDSVSNDTVLTAMFRPYSGIRNTYYERPYVRTRREMPTVKEVRERVSEPNGWKFWIVIAILFYVALVRIVNPNNFRLFIFSVFNLRLSEKIWDEQRSFFGFVILQLFSIYIFIAALFISNLLDLKHIILLDNGINLFFVIVVILFLVYLMKFILHAFFGYLLQMNKLGIGFVSNTISVNNFIALIILPLLVFFTWNRDPVIRTILSQTVIATFFLSIVYRMVRITLLSNSFFSFPRIYLFIYLCALEVLPWFVIIKYLNGFQI
jgi:hypothetical protein